MRPAQTIFQKLLVGFTAIGVATQSCLAAVLPCPVILPHSAGGDVASTCCNAEATESSPKSCSCCSDKNECCCNSDATSGHEPTEPSCCCSHATVPPADPSRPVPVRPLNRQSGIAEYEFKNTELLPVAVRLLVATSVPASAAETHGGLCVRHCCWLN
jgi:hypothetical protein